MSQTKPSKLNQEAAPGNRRRLPAILAALRPKQWVKNGLVAAAALFTADKPRTLHDYIPLIVAILVFCLVSGCTYIINDIRDVDNDREHPKKKLRPIASGELKISTALTFSAIGIVVGLAAAFWVGPKFLAATIAYLAITLAYSLWLKHIVILDVLTLASLFVIRAAAGAFAIHVGMSEWLLLCTLLLALFLGLAKRRGEVSAHGTSGSTRAILQEYSIPMLDQLLTIAASSSIMAYTLYSFFSDTGKSHPYLMATIPFVLHGIMRYLYLIHKHGVGETPEATLIEDKPLVATVILYAIAAGVTTILH
jgi:4-hydroxybenzoate polyprenyltransferase